jgi:GT2 family glycosyltransferase
MQLSIVIVNYNTKKLTVACLESIFTHLGATIPFEVIVVDNGSSDGSQEAVRAFASTRKNVLLMEAGENLGFAKGNNIGIRKASGSQVLLLNSDTFLIDDSILQAVRYLDDRPDVFGCGCTLLNADGAPGISHGRFPELGVVFREILTWRSVSLRTVVPRRPSEIRAIDFPCGAFFLMRRELLDKIGLLDERFFMYFEETDLAKRAWKAGYRVMHFGPARVVHLGGQSSGAGAQTLPPDGTPRALDVQFYLSWRRYLGKHRSELTAAIVGALLSLFFKSNYLIFCLLQRDTAKARHGMELRALHAGWRRNE